MPYLGERSGGKRRLQDTEEASTLITNTLRNLVTSSTHLLMIGAATVPFVYMLNGFVKILLETGKDFYQMDGTSRICIPVLVSKDTEK